MRLYLYINLDNGGAVTIQGHDLSPDDMKEVFSMLSGKEIVTQEAFRESIDEPLPRSQGQG